MLGFLNCKVEIYECLVYLLTKYVQMSHWLHMYDDTYSRPQELFYKLFSKITNKLVKYFLSTTVYLHNFMNLKSA